MKFSIIVPVYNSERSLWECVNSVLAQLCQDWEMILVDDGSTDGSGEICDQFAEADKRIHVIHQKNQGQLFARRSGIQRAQGNYLLFLDSDDYYSLDLLEQLSDIVTQYRPEAVLFDGVRFEGNQEQICVALDGGIYGTEIHDSLILDRKKHTPVINHGLSMKLLSKEHYLRYQLPVPGALYKGEDMAVSVPLLADCKRVAVTHCCGYFYRDTPGSVMNSFRDNEWQQIVLLTDYLESMLPKEYGARIDAYAVQQLFDFADRAMLFHRYSDYRALASKASQALLPRLKRFRGRSRRWRERLALWLTKHRCFGMLWLLRKVKPRK